MKISKKLAAIQSLASLTASLITPNRIGEYGAKALYFEKSFRKQILGLNFIGNFYQLTITLVFGILGFGYFIKKQNIELNYSKILTIFSFTLILAFGLIFILKYYKYTFTYFNKLKIFLRKIPTHLNLKVALLSLLRYVVFSHQFYFLLMIFKLDVSYFDAVSAITSVYFISSVIPILSLFDAILKGTVAIYIFSFLSIDTFTTLSITTIMWILNFVLPAIFGSYFVFTFKPKFAE